MWGRNRSRCNSLHWSTQCGPLATVYTRVVISCPGGQALLTSDNVTLSQGGRERAYKVSEVAEVRL